MEKGSKVFSICRKSWKKRKRRVLTGLSNDLPHPGRLMWMTLEAEQAERYRQAEIQFLEAAELGAAQKRGLAYDKLLEVVKLNPKHASAMQKLGFFALTRRRYNVAIDWFKQVLELRPTDAQAAFNLASAYEGVKKNDLAIHYYTAALSLNPGYLDARFNLALLYQEQCKHWQAIRQWQLFLKAVPRNHPDYHLACGEMVKLRKQVIVKNAITGGPSSNQIAI